MRWLILLLLCVASGIGGWQAALIWGVDYSRIPQSPFTPEQEVVINGAEPAIVSIEAAELREALFARHNKIDISDRFESGRIQHAAANSALKVVEVDIDMALVKQDQPASTERFWISLERLEASN